MDRRKIDALVAEKVMGWRRLPTEQPPFKCQQTGMDAYRWKCADGGLQTDPPNYSTDISAAWQVVEKLKSTGSDVNISAFSGKDRFSCRVGVDSKTGHFSTADTAPLAICLAALSAIGVEVEASPAE